MIIGEGTNEIQRNVIVRQLVARGGLDLLGSAATAPMRRRSR